MPLPFHLEKTGPTVITVQRGFAHPPAKVWRALTESDLVLKWMGMPGYPIAKAEIDLRVGGGFRYEWDTPEGGIMGVTGEYLELGAPTRMVHTELFDEDWTDGTTTLVTELRAVEAGTRLVQEIHYRSEDGLEMALQNGMDEGTAITFEQLDALLTGAAAPGA